jgi:16S rRNA (adenine1518-N6/adenine1519-N6)-dimethyltransferase
MNGSASEGTVRFRAKKGLGQHFLRDPRIIYHIISRAGFQGADQVLEIGPGKGALTLPLAQTVAHITAVEKDRELIEFLEKRLSQKKINNVTLIHADILKWDFQELARRDSSKIKVIGNLPYNISTPFLDKLVDNRACVSKAVLMFQLEIAQRLAAGPGSKTYGAMSVLVQYHAHATALLKVPRDAFSPKPKINSMVLELDFEHPHPTRAVDEANFRKVVKGAFSHRRKTVLNSLKDYFPSPEREQIVVAITRCNIDPGSRAETLNIDDFIRLASAIELTSNQAG